MIPWTLLGDAPIPDSPDRLLLWQRGDEFSLRISGYVSELMNSRQHGSEEALATEALGLLGRPEAQVLVGGLGMGFTLAAALRGLGAGGRVTVAELVPGVVEWNRAELGAVAGRPLDDPRTAVVLGDVGAHLRGVQGRYDAVLLDVDNGPDSMTHSVNGWLYSPGGLRAIRQSLRPGGVLAVWSAYGDERFTRRLGAAGYAAEVRSVRARAGQAGGATTSGTRPGKNRQGGKGARHTVWLATVQPEKVQPERPARTLTLRQQGARPRQKTRAS